MLKNATAIELTESEFYDLLSGDPEDRPIIDLGVVAIHRSCDEDALLIETPCGTYGKISQ